MASLELEETSEEQTENNITELNSYFTGLLDLVPSSIFFDADANQKLIAHRRKQDGASPTDAHKKSSKKFKFDPEAPTKTTDLQKVMPSITDILDFEETKVSSNSSHRINGLVAHKTPPVTIVSSGDENDGECHSDAEKVGRKGNKRKRPLQGHSSTEKATLPETDEDRSGETSGSELLLNRPNPDHLREKLRARIAELQSKRQKGMTAEEFLESKRLRRKESKLKLKQKRKEAKKLKLSIEKQKKNSESKMNGVSEVEPGPSKTNGNTMVFSKFQFSEQARKPKEAKQKKPKSYKELYMKVTQDKERLEKLRQEDSEKAQRLEERQAWKKAMDMSKGTKVKDNPELLKRSMKKEEKQKNRSQKKWQERVDGVSEQQQKRQEKRKKNIQAKKQSNIDRKIKLAKKKGRIVSGF